MRMTLVATAVLLTVSLLGCKDRNPAPTPAAAKPTDPTPVTPPPATPPASATPASAPAVDCKTQAAELRAFITAVIDPGQKVAAPWPTGDAEFDRDLDALRAAVREQLKPEDPAARAPKLTPGITPGRLEKELGPCPEATAQLIRVGEVALERRAETYIALADAIAACDCAAKIPRVKALIYLGNRGPD
jgi:hypothetical protein